ncbi:bactofilin family protein [Chryseobacterium gossypii]|uniref:bactofilin family protein n=1 Tax=Chryseobacterium gossypii TaxID=3231602 RepID=UPI0035232EA6
MLKNLLQSKKPDKNIEELSVSTLLSSGVLVRGDIKGPGVVRIDGEVEGNILLDEGVILGEKSRVKGSVTSGIVAVYGRLEGDINCHVLYIKSSGVVEGKINTVSLSVDMGGRYNGSLVMNEAGAMKPADKKAE